MTRQIAIAISHTAISSSCVLVATPSRSSAPSDSPSPKPAAMTTSTGPLNKPSSAITADVPNMTRTTRRASQPARSRRVGGWLIGFALGKRVRWTGITPIVLPIGPGHRCEMSTVPDDAVGQCGRRTFIASRCPLRTCRAEDSSERFSDSSVRAMSRGAPRRAAEWPMIDAWAERITINHPLPANRAVPGRMSALPLASDSRVRTPLATAKDHPRQLGDCRYQRGRRHGVGPCGGPILPYSMGARDGTSRISVSGGWAVPVASAACSDGGVRTGTGERPLMHSGRRSTSASSMSNLASTWSSLGRSCDASGSRWSLRAWPRSRRTMVAGGCGSPLSVWVDDRRGGDSVANMEGCPWRLRGHHHRSRCRPDKRIQDPRLRPHYT